MANSDKNIRITANRDTTALPKIIFTGQSNNPIALNVLDDNTISFEGSAGQLFSINNNLSSGYIFSINDISGIPSFRVNADGTVGIAEFLGNVGIGLTNPAYKLQISGSAGISGTANISGVLTLSSTTGSGSTSTGALVVSGGVGIGGSIFSSSAYASSLSGVVFNNGAITNTGTITSTGVVSISNSSTTAFQVRDGSNSSKFNVDTIGGIVSVLSSTASTSTSSGALVVSGGVGIGGSVIVGGRVGIGTVPNLSMLNIQTSSAGTTGLSISASTSQSANLFEWYADLYGGGGFALAGTVRPTGQVHLGTPGFLTMSNGGSALLGLQGRGTSEGLAIRGYNSNLNNPLFEVQGNPGNQLFGIYGDGGVNAPRINVTNSTGSTNSSSGALIVTGGVGIGGTLSVNTANVIRDFNHTPNITTIGGASGWVASTASTFISPGTFRYLNNKYIGIGGTYVYYSDDMINWSSVMVPNLDPARPIANITYGEGKYVFVQYYTANAGYSTNLTNWTNVAIQYQTWNDVIYGNGRFVATVGGDLAAYSLDGTSWTSVTDSIALGFNTSLKFLNGYFYVTNANAISRSIDGIIWQVCNTPAVPYGLAYGNGLYVGGIYNSGTIVYSYDGLNFSSYSGSSFVHNGSFFYNGVYYLTTQNNNVIRYSTDGFNWTNSTGFPGAVFNLQYIKGFLYAGSGNTVWVTNATPGRFEVNPLRTGTLDDVEIGRLSPNNANFIDVSVNNNLNVSSQYSSISPLNGALTVAGGVGIGGSLYVASATAISGVTINAGVITGSLSGTATTSTYSHQSGYAITTGSSGTATTANSVRIASAGSSNSNHLITFTPNSSSSGSAISSDSTFSFNPSTEILSVSGIAITSTSASGSSTTGALIVTGGVGIGGSVNIGRQLTVSGTARLNSSVFNNPPTSSIGASLLQSGYIFGSYWTGFQIENGYLIYGRQVPGGFIIIEEPLTGAQVGGTGNVFAEALQHFKWGNDKYVVLASTGNSVLYSTSSVGAGNSWYYATLPTTASWQKLEYGNNRFIAIATGSTSAYSLDGINWTLSTLPGSYTWSDIKHGNGVFVAGAGSTVAYTYDGIEWTIASNNVSSTYITFGNGLFFANSTSNTASYSRDGINWTNTTLPSDTHRASAYGNGVFVNVGNSTTSYYSTDLITWISGPGGSDGTTPKFLYFNNLFYFKENGSGYGKVVTGPSGTLDFSPRFTGDINNVRIGAENPGAAEFTALSAVGPVRFVSNLQSTSTKNGALVVTGGVGIGQSLFTSSSYASSISGVTFNNGAITNTGTITSTGVMSISNSSTTAFAVRDGSNSSKFNVDTVGGIVSVLSSTASTTTSSGALVVSGGVGIGGTLNVNRLKATSKITFEPGTGTSAVSGWTGIALTSISKMIYAANRFVGVGGSYVAYSSDGVNFTYTTIPGQTSAALYGDVAYGNGVFVAVNAQNSAFTAYSYDGAAWGTTSIPSGQIRSVGYGNGKFIAIAEVGSSVYSSTDGRSWSTISSLGGYGAETVFINGYFFAVRSGDLYYSIDGTRWTMVNKPSGNSIQSISYGKGLYIAPTYNSSEYYTSTDLITWTIRTIDNRVWMGSSYVNGVFYLIPNNNNNLYHSLDGINWSTTNFGTSIGGYNKFFTANDRLYFYSTWNPNLWSTDATTGTLMVKPFYNGELENTRIGAVNPDSATFTHLTAFNNVTFTSATASTGADNGALVVKGGVGIGGSLYVASATAISGVTINAGVITGSLTGTATTSTYSHQSGYAITSSSSGTATTSNYSHQSGYAITSGSSATATTATYSHQSGYATTSGLATTATYSHQSGYATTSGLATTATYSHQSGYATTSGLATTATYANQSGYGITAGLATTATYAHQSGYAITSGSSGSATTANNINVANALTNSAHTLLFSPTATGSGVAVSSNTTLSYNPSSNVLSTSGLAITATTASSSTSNGALQVAGGVGISGRLSFNQAAFGTTGIATNPTMAMIGNTGDPIFLSILEDNTISFEGSQGQLFSITPNLSTGYIYSVNDITGIPLLRANANANVTANEYAGNFGIGLSNPGYKLHVVGSVGFTSTTASTSTTTGTLVVSGGVGIGGSLYVNSPSNISNVIINNGVITGNLTGTATTSGFATTASYSNQAGYAITAGSSNTSGYATTSGLATTATYSHQSGYGLTSGFATTASYAYQSGYGLTSGFATTSSYSHQAGYAITAGSATTAFTAVSTTSVSVASAGNSNLAHPILITNNPSSGSAVSSDSTFTFNPSTEILSVSGISVTSTTASTSYNSGALVVSGGVGIGGSLFVNGDLTINGTTTTINSVTISVDDKNIELGSVSSPSDLTAEGGGITLKGATDKFINWYSGVGWSSSESWNLVSGNSYKINNASVLTSTTLGTGVTNSSLTSLGTITTGVWAGTLITANYGGVGLTTPFTVGDILYANTSTTWGRLTAGTSGHLLSSTGTGSTPSYVNPNTLTVGTATTASNLRIAVASSNLSHPVLFTPGSSTSGSAVSSDSTFSFNSSTEILSVSGVAITSTTSSSGSTTGALTVAGGVGIGGTVNIAGDETVLGRLYYSQSTVGVAGTSTIPSISFIGQDNNPITLSVLTDNTLSFEGSSGQLFSINNNLSSGTIFSVNDISGIPIIRANANGTLSMGEFTGTVGVGLTNPSFKFHVSGSAGFSGTIYATGNVSLASNTASTSTTNGALTIAGGVGIGGSLYVASATAISGVTINAGVITGSLTGTASTATYAHQSGYAITSGFATTASYAYQSGYAITSGSSGSATTAFNINIVSATTNASHPVLFTPASGTASGAALSTESTFVFNPSTDILSVSGLAITSGTASIGPTSGALVVAGGVGISGSLRVGDRANTSFSGYQIAGFAVSFNNHANFVIQNAHPGPANHTRLFLANDLNNYAEITYANSYPSFSFPNYLNISNNFGNIHIGAGSGFTINMTSLRLDSTGAVTTVVTASTSPTTGGFRVAGGAGIAKTSYFGQDLIIQGTTGSGSTTTGALVVTGGVGIGQTLFTSSSYASSISGVVFNNGAITNTGTITSTGVMSISNSSTTALSVKDGSNDTKFNVNTIGGIVSVSSSTASTNTSTGAFTVSGGVGIGGTLNANSVITYNRLQNQSFSGTAIGATDGRMGGYGAISGHDRITFGNGIFVTNSSWGAYNAAYSTDGLNWTASSLPVNQGYPVTMYGNGYFVLAATGATNVLYSANGSSWSQVSIGNTESRTTGAYGNGKYVIVGSGTTYNYSSNLTTWNTGALPLTADWRIAYGNGVFVAIGYGSNRLIYSYDGINWNIGNVDSVDRNFMKITYANGKFMVTGWSGGGTWYSYDGINWVVTSNSGGDVYNLSYGNGAYFTNDALKYTYSSDGFNWSSFVNFSAGYESFQSAYGLNKFITGGRVIDGPTNTVTIEPKFTGEINNVRIGAVTPASGDFTNLSSTGSANLVGTVNANNLNIISKVNQTPVLGGFAGTNGWTSSGLLTGTNNNYALAFGNGLFVQVRKATNYTSFSSDGKRWIASSMPFSGDWLDIAWGKDKFVAIASAGATGAYSGNGITWSSMNMPTNTSGWYAVTYGDEKFVAVGNGATVAYSSDGISWTGAAIANTNWTGIAYGNGTFVAVAGSGQSGAYSYDGINWNLSNLPTNGGGIKFITYGNGYFIVTNYVSTAINYSRDGINWSTSTRTSTFSFHTDLAYGNGIYSTFNYAEASYSYDAINWLNGNTIAATDWQAVAYGNNRFVATSVNTSQVGSIDGPSNTLNLHPKFTGDIDNVRIGSKEPAAAEFTNLAAQQPVRFTSNTASINSNTGALVVVGGVGIGGSLYVASATAISGVTINAGVITGSLTGTASTATYSHQSGYAITSGSSGAATTATYSHQSGYATTSGFATTATYSYQSGYGLTSGLATTATYSHQSGYATTSGLATTATYAHQSGYATTSGLATTATYAHQSGYATTSGFATSATSASIANTSYSVNVNAASANASHFLIFSPTATGSGVALSSESALVYNPSTDILSVSGLAVTSGTASTSATTGALVVTGGVGIGLTLTVGLGISTPVISAPANLLLKPGVDSTTGIQFTRSSAALPVLTIDTLNSRVGIGLTNPEFDFEVNGSISATTKSFVIEHPTKQGMKLRYGSLEGPENGVYVRGELKDNNKIILPDYWSELVDESSITVHLTPIGNKFVYVKEIKKDSIIVGSMFFQKIHCYYSVWAERKDVPKLKVEF